ncbi:hypothetical protein VEIDISOL_00715 [Veillonella dispar ATCC 17748]|uniref:Phage gp6-like head-tail connector protein n=1 Tax=Veillonella dispar ATCC 17748 TaxID=546273 RepID=C4FP91_9FIRM|nr:hypothetical protein [Veillonella dispar]EEP65911.1 hypothetical protein VEIDISOL_00715 [Veillonella dispar ATCC 17748]VEG93143.1 Uncharacterised protein [Veillonella dispar]
MTTKETVLQILESWLGYDAISDINIIEYMIDAETQHILNDINQKELPSELQHVLVYRVIGSYITTNKNKLIEADGEMASSIKMGDTEVQFKGTDKASRLQELDTALSGYGRGDLACFRRLRW